MALRTKTMKRVALGSKTWSKNAFRPSKQSEIVLELKNLAKSGSKIQTLAKIGSKFQ